MTRTAGSARQLVRRVTLIVVALLLAAAAVVNTADRLDRRGRLPAPLAALLVGDGAKAQMASRLYMVGEVEMARPLALAAVRAEPGNQVAVRTLGLAELARGNAVRGDALLRAAGTLGWRDAPTQTFWANVAAQAGEYTIAAQRLDAVMRMTMSRNPEVAQLVVAFEASPEGRAALVERMVVQNNWSNPYISDLASLKDEQLDDRATLASALATRRAPLTRETFVAIENGLVTRGYARQAYAIRVARAPKGTSTDRLLTNGSFEEPLLDPSSVFDWRTASGDTATLEIATAPAPLSGRALHIRSGGASSAQLLEQYVVLPPGSYVLRLDMLGQQTDEPLLVQATAVTGTEAAVTSLPTKGKRRAWLIRVDADADAHVLRLILTSAEARRAGDVWIYNMSLESERRSAR